MWLRDLRPDLPEPFIRAIEPALAPDPRNRYVTAGEMEQALLAAVPELEPRSAVRADLPSQAAKPDGVRWTDGVPRMVIAAAATAVLILATSVVLAPRVLRQSASGGRSGGSPPATPASGGHDELTTRRVALPPLMFAGRPSPDGRYFSYVDVNGDLCVHELSDGTNRCLTNKGQSEERGGEQIAISRDGKRLAYSWLTLDRTNEIRLVGEDGAWPRVLFRRPDVTFANPVEWTTDGNRILIIFGRAKRGNHLALLSAADGAVEGLAPLREEHRNATLSRDGSFVAFDTAQDSDPRARDVFVMDVRQPSTPSWPLVQHPANDRFPMWTADGRLLFVSDRTGSLGLWVLRIDGGRAVGEPELVVRDMGRFVRPLGLTDAGALFYSVQNGMVDVFTQTVDFSGATAPGKPQSAMPTLVGSNISSDWSPDGRYLAYVSISGLSSGDRYSRSLVVLDLEGGTQRHLALPLNFFIGPRWSRDGETLLVRGADLQDRQGIFAVDLRSGSTQPALVFPADRIQSATFEWSPDGRAIWYDKTGARAVVAYDLTTGRESVVFNYAGESIQRLQQWPGLRVSPDGDSVAYTGFTFENNVAGTVVRVRTGDGRSVELARATTPEMVEMQDWLPNGDAVVVLRRNTKARSIELQELRLDGTPPRPLGIIGTQMRDVRVRRDGKAITYTAGAPAQETWVLERFLMNTASQER
jgi:Tol biopolymer transport system component